MWSKNSIQALISTSSVEACSRLPSIGCDGTEQVAGSVKEVELLVLRREIGSFGARQGGLDTNQQTGLCSPLLADSFLAQLGDASE